MAKNNSPKFPTTVYGVVVYNAFEGREVCKKHDEKMKAERAAEAARQTEAEIARLMESHYTYAEAHFLATGGVPCRSISAFV